ncbi:MAG: hypothetical protein QOI06_2420 [Nocardioidaceae bacterium]|nr:hypothetical protein [Nocardioidaceae bacterium]
MRISGLRRRAPFLAALAVVVLVQALLSPYAAATTSVASRIAPRTASPKIVLDEPSPQTLYEDNATRVSGHLPNGKQGKLVVLRDRVDGGQWHKVGATSTDAAGAFVFDLEPADPGSVDVQASHPTGHGAQRSNIQPVHVLNRRLFLVSRPSYTTFGSIVMSGTTRPLGAGRRIVVQRLVAGRWVSERSGFTDSNGHYAVSMPDDVPGAWTVRTYWPAGDPAGGTAEFSATHHYTVRALLAPVVTRATARQLGGSYHVGCPVGPALLRNVDVTFHTFGDTVARGTLVVRDTIVRRVITTWRLALQHGYPIRKMFPAAHYGGSDIKSMYHDNTSAFNCRQVTGDPTSLSPHSYGVAIDVNTVENPYQDVHGTWWPRTIGQQYRDRSHRHPGMLYGDSVVTSALTRRGFRWGGDWFHPDYQHFDTFSNANLDRSAAARAGPLTARAMPPARELGPEWRRYADPGGAEARWLGNGTFVHARQSFDAARGVLPLGCAYPLRTALPKPRFALQGSYRSRAGAPAQAVVLQFGSPRAATSYFGGLERRLVTCRSPDGPTGVAVRPRLVTSTSYAGQRTYSGHETWTEADTLSGARVTVLLSRG